MELPAGPEVVEEHNMAGNGPHEAEELQAPS